MPTPSPSPIPVEVVYGVPDWITGVAVPIAAAAIAAFILVIGLAGDRKRREKVRRALLAEYVSQMLIEAAALRDEHEGEPDQLNIAGMRMNIYQVRAVGQMKLEEHRVIQYYAGIAKQVLTDPKITDPQARTTAAISSLLNWLAGTKKTSDYPEV